MACRYGDRSTLALDSVPSAGLSSQVGFPDIETHSFSTIITYFYRVTMMSYIIHSFIAAVGILQILGFLLFLYFVLSRNFKDLNPIPAFFIHPPHPQPHPSTIPSNCLPHPDPFPLPPPLITQPKKKDLIPPPDRKVTDGEAGWELLEILDINKKQNQHRIDYAFLIEQFDPT